jgi:hypothetical protein
MRREIVTRGGRVFDCAVIGHPILQLNLVRVRFSRRAGLTAIGPEGQRRRRN